MVSYGSNDRYPIYKVNGNALANNEKLKSEILSKVKIKDEDENKKKSIKYENLDDVDLFWERDEDVIYVVDVKGNKVDIERKIFNEDDLKNANFNVFNYDPNDLIKSKAVGDKCKFKIENKNNPNMKYRLFLSQCKNLSNEIVDKNISKIISSINMNPNILNPTSSRKTTKGGRNKSKVIKDIKKKLKKVGDKKSYKKLKKLILEMYDYDLINLVNNRLVLFYNPVYDYMFNNLGLLL